MHSRKYTEPVIRSLLPSSCQPAARCTCLLGSPLVSHLGGSWSFVDNELSFVQSCWEWGNKHAASCISDAATRIVVLLGGTARCAKLCGMTGHAYPVPVMRRLWVAAVGFWMFVAAYSFQTHPRPDDEWSGSYRAWSRVAECTLSHRGWHPIHRGTACRA